MAAESCRRDAGDLRLIAIAAAAIVAAADWITVARGVTRAEAVLKPLVPILLIVSAATVHAWWFAAALVLCLVGDVLLLPQVDRFRGGLAAFLLAHLAFIGGFVAHGLRVQRLGFGAGMLLFVVVFAPPLLRSVPRPLLAAVLAYLSVILGMFTAALLGGGSIALLGASLFVVSDTLLAWNRFVRPLPTGRVGVMVTYHLALALLTLTLVL